MKVSLNTTLGYVIKLDTTDGEARISKDNGPEIVQTNCTSLTTFLIEHYSKILSFTVLVPFREITFVKNEVGDFIRTADGEPDDFVPYAYKLNVPHTIKNAVLS